VHTTVFSQSLVYRNASLKVLCFKSLYFLVWSFKTTSFDLRRFSIEGLLRRFPVTKRENYGISCENFALGSYSMKSVGKVVFNLNGTVQLNTVESQLYVSQL